MMKTKKRRENIKVLKIPIEKGRAYLRNFNNKIKTMMMKMQQT